MNSDPIDSNNTSQPVDSDNSNQSTETNNSNFVTELFSINAAFVAEKSQNRSLWVNVLVNQVEVKTLYDPGDQLSLKLSFSSS